MVSWLTVMEYQRCAALHNEILFRGWTGSGQDWIQPQTWWENQVPSEETARRLSPPVIEFLKRAYLIPDSPTPFCFFFYLGSLAPASQMLSNGFLDESRYYIAIWKLTLESGRYIGSCVCLCSYWLE
jgi:hypothetical protein